MAIFVLFGSHHRPFNEKTTAIPSRFDPLPSCHLHRQSGDSMILLIHKSSIKLDTTYLDTLQRRMLLELAVDLLARVILRALAVQTEQSTEIELGCL